MIRVVLDTNVLVAGFAAPSPSTSTPGTLVQLWFEDRFEVIASPEILAEVERTLQKPFYASHQSAARIQRVAATFFSRVAFVTPSKVVTIATHPEDDLILAAAIAARVDYLVTGDAQLQRLERIEQIPIISPRAFLDILDTPLA